ncbi:MAG: GHKL domain-containing protein [Thiotrichaceae bacterium]|nr:GHKL domain-containing protein [Thiotrichaceae bacterium]
MFRKNTPGRLSKTLAIYLYLFSSLVTLITTTVQLSLNYNKEMTVIEASGNILKKSYLKSLTTAAWNFNDEQLQTLIEGLEIYPNVCYVGVIMKKKVYAQAGKMSTHSSDIIPHEWKLFSDENKYIGKIIVQISTKAPLESLYDEIKMTLFTNFIKMFFIATFLILLVEYLITRHLKHLADDLDKAQSFESLQGDIVLMSKRNHKNEIDSVVLAINQMRSKLKRLWSQLQMSEQNYRHIIDNSGQGILINNETQSIHCNKEILKLFNIKTIDEFKQHLNTINASAKDLNNRHPNQLPPMLEISIPKNKSTDSEQRIVQHFFHNVLWSGEPATVHFFIDITAVKILEKKNKQQEAHLIQADKMNSLGVMVSGITHEINNPNHLIRINIDTLSRIWEEIQPILDHYATQHPDWHLSNIPYSEIKPLLPVAIRDIKQGSIQIQNIITDLKDFIRSKGSAPFNYCNVNSTIHDVLHILQPHISKRGINVSYLPTSPDLQIEAQQTHLNQVFVNLILNAIQSCKKNTGVVKITVEQVENNVVFRVKDNGYGIEKERLKNIFDLFHSSKKDTGGTGIGLAIVYRLIQLHQGTIDVQSEVGKGSIFNVTLPIQQ